MSPVAQVTQPGSGLSAQLTKGGSRLLQSEEWEAGLQRTFQEPLP